MALTGWVNSIPDISGGSFKVAKNPQGRDYGPVDHGSPPKGVLHTTEGTQEVPNYGSSSPHLTIGKNSIHQHRAFGRMAGALRNESGGVETNRLVRIQIELVEFSEIEPWTPDSDKQVDMLASVLEWAEQELGVPEKHVFRDDARGMSLPWAVSNNKRRRTGRFPGTPGWYYHLEVPENSHWDCGSLEVTPIMAREPISLVRAHAVYLSYGDKESGDWHRHSQRMTPFFAKRWDARTFVLAKRKRALWRAMRGKVYSRAHDALLDVRTPRPKLVTKRVRSNKVR